MSNLPYIHSYARQLLEEKEFKIFSNGVEILPPVGKIYSIPEVRAYVKIGTQDFQPSEQVIKINYQKLQDIGFKIASESFTGWFRGQRQRYEIVKMASLKSPLKDIPKDHFVEYDTLNKAVRLKGRCANWNGVGNWSFKNPPRQFDNRDFVKRYIDERSNLIGEKKEEETLQIPKTQIPVMKDEDGRIICIEEQSNEPCVGVCGARRMKNSWFMHGLADRAYWRWKKKIAVMNDGLDETDTWCLPWEEHPTLPSQWIRELKKLNEPSIPLPCVYLTSEHFGVTDDDVFFPKEVGFKISLPFRDMVFDWDNFTKGNSKWTFQKSGLYFNQLFFNDDGTPNEDALGVKTFGDIEAIMREKWTDRKTGEIDKKFEGVFMRVRETMRHIWNYRILDVSNDIPAKWTVQMPDKYKVEVDPFVACLLADLVPVFITKKLKSSSAGQFPQEFKHRLNQIFRAQKEVQYLKKNNAQVWIVVDEILSIAATDYRTVAAEEIERVVRESGPARIGFLYRAQNYNRVLKELRKNTGYLFAFKQDDEGAKTILRDFSFGGNKTYAKQLTSLKRGEVMAFTSNKFIAYDPTTGESEDIMAGDKPVKGTVLPPLSWHKAPKDYGA